MNDEGVRHKTQVASPAELAAAREARGMSQLDISQRIKLQVKQVNALEEGQWEALPGKSFVRGALRSYGKLLDIDVAPLLESIGGFAEPAQVQGMKPLEAPLSRSSGLGFNGGGRGSPILWVIAGLIGVVALVLYFGSDTDASRIRSWLPSSEKPSGTATDPAAPVTPGSPAAPNSPSSSSPPPASGDGGAPSAPSPSGSAAPGNGSIAGASGSAASPDGAMRQPVVLSNLQALPQAAAHAGAAGSPVPGGAGAGGSTYGSASALTLATGSPAPVSLPPGNSAHVASANGASANGTAANGTAANGTAGSGGAAAGSPAALPSLAAAASSAEPATAVDVKGVMQVSAKQDAWIEVRQADGTALHNGLLKAGAGLELKGSPPYRLILGNASHVDLSYEGKPQDLAPHIRANNIARLQLR